MTLPKDASVHSVLTPVCASKSCTFAAAAQHCMSKTPDMTLSKDALAHSVWGRSAR